MNPLAIIAWYGVILLGGEWNLVGPYDNRDECTFIMEFLEGQGYETETCTMIDTGVESIWYQLPPMKTADAMIQMITNAPEIITQTMAYFPS